MKIVYKITLASTVMSEIYNSYLILFQMQHAVGWQDSHDEEKMENLRENS